MEKSIDSDPDKMSFVQDDESRHDDHTHLDEEGECLGHLQVDKPKFD